MSDCFNRVREELHKRGTVTLGLLDTTLPYPRESIRGALEALFDNGEAVRGPGVGEYLRARGAPAPEAESGESPSRHALDLLTMLCTQPRRSAQLEHAVSWSPLHLRECLEELHRLNLAHPDATMTWRPTPAGYANRGYPSPPRQDTGGRKDVVELRLDTTEAVKDLAELKASIRDDRAFKVLLALLATTSGPGGAEELARRAYALVDALEAAR